MKEALIAIVCLCTGIVIGYYFGKDGDTSTPCSLSDCCKILAQHPDTCNLNPTIPGTISIVADTSTIKQAYRNHMRRPEAIGYGYSVDKDLITFLHGQLGENPSIEGFRMYPGFDNSVNKTIFIALIRNASGTSFVESVNLVKGFQFNSGGLMGYIGPCPDWCDSDSRVIRN